MGVHWLEEVPGFAAWASAHFAPMSSAWFILSHVPLFAFAGVVTARASRPDPPRVAVWGAWVLASALGANAIFHMGATLAFGEYSPGLVTAVLLYVPLTVVSARPFYRALGGSWGAATATGIVVSAMLVATLWIDTRL